VDQSKCLSGYLIKHGLGGRSTVLLKALNQQSA